MSWGTFVYYGMVIMKYTCAPPDDGDDYDTANNKSGTMTQVRDQPSDMSVTEVGPGLESSNLSQPFIPMVLSDSQVGDNP